MIDGTYRHAVRREHEVRDALAAIEEAGQPADMTRATLAWFERINADPEAREGTDACSRGPEQRSCLSRRCSGLARGAPAAVVLGARRLGVGGRADTARTAICSCGSTVVFLEPPSGSPQTTRTSVPIGDVGVDRGQREAAALVGGDAREQRQPDDVAVGVDDGVVVRRAVVRVREVEELVARARRGRSEDARIFARSSSFQARVTFLRWLAWVDLLEGVAADEVVVELHERAVAELPRGSGSSPRCPPETNEPASALIAS